MEKQLGSLFPYQQFELQSSNGNLASYGQSLIPAHINPYMNEVSVNWAFPYSGLPPSRVGQLTEPGTWFYCLPRFKQAFLPPSPSMVKEKIGSGLNNYVTNGGADAAAARSHKRFLVFDQSGDQTTLLYSSGMGTPIGHLSSWKPEPPFSCGVVKEDLLDGNANSQFLPFRNLGLNQECHKDDTDSEMHEDTDELNALLYSDDENYLSEDDEVTSTGQSPSTMTDHGIHHLSEGYEEVASSAYSSKRQKLLDGKHNVPPLVPAIGSQKPLYCVFEDDAESYCGNFDDQSSSKSLCLSGRKRSKKEKIQKTVRLLQKMIPGAEGKDAVGVIDEAVHYLKSMREKAQSLHFNAL